MSFPEIIASKLKEEIKRRGFSITSESKENDKIIIQFRNDNIFKKTEKIFGASSLMYATSACIVHKDMPIIECNITSPVKKHIEFYISTEKESYRPHFYPEDNIAAIELSLPLSEESVQKISTILDSFLNSQGVIDEKY